MRTELAETLAIEGGALLSVDPPRASMSEAASLLGELFGLSGELTPLSSERDQNFHVRVGGGRSYVLRITNAAEPALFTEFQTEALLHVARRDPAVPVPRLVPSRAGNAISWADRAGARSAIRLMTFLEGRPAYAMPRSPALLRSMAHWLARLDLALADFDHPGADQELIWDISHASRMRRRLEQIEDPDKRSLALGFLDRFDGIVMPIMGSLRRQVVHNDMNPHNILVSGHPGDSVSGLLDFGDMVRTCLINEIAVAASYLNFLDEDPLAEVAVLAAAYHAVLPLEARELSILVDLIAARQLVTIAITEWRAQLYPDNRDYILRNNPSAWAGLQGLERVDRTEAGEALMKSCGVAG